MTTKAQQNDGSRINKNSEGHSETQECILDKLGFCIEAGTDLTMSDVLGTYSKINYRAGAKHNTWYGMDNLADEIGVSKPTLYRQMGIIAMWGLVTSYEVLTSKGMHIHYVVSDHILGCRFRVEPLIPTMEQIHDFPDTQVCNNCTDDGVKILQVRKGKLQPAETFAPQPRRQRGGGIVSPTVKGFRSVSSAIQGGVLPTIQGAVLPTIQEITKLEITKVETINAASNDADVMMATTQIDTADRVDAPTVAATNPAPIITLPVSKPTPVRTSRPKVEKPPKPEPLDPLTLAEELYHLEHCGKAQTSCKRHGYNPSMISIFAAWQSRVATGELTEDDLRYGMQQAGIAKGGNKFSSMPKPPYITTCMENHHRDAARRRPAPNNTKSTTTTSYTPKRTLFNYATNTYGD